MVLKQVEEEFNDASHKENVYDSFDDQKTFGTVPPKENFYTDNSPAGLVSSVSDIKLSDREKQVVANVNKTFLIRYIISTCFGVGAGVWYMKKKQITGWKAFALISSTGILGEIIGRKTGTFAAMTELNQNLPPESQLRNFLEKKNLVKHLNARLDTDESKPNDIPSPDNQIQSSDALELSKKEEDNAYQSWDKVRNINNNLSTWDKIRIQQSKN